MVVLGGPFDGPLLQCQGKWTALEWRAAEGSLQTMRATDEAQIWWLWHAFDRVTILGDIFLFYRCVL